MVANRDTAGWIERAQAVWSERAADWDRMAEAAALGADRTADVARLAVELDLHHGSSLLDAGCGTGQWSVAFAHLGCTVTAQDLSPAMVDRARDHARDRGVEITFRTGDITKLPDARNSFDAIHARVVLQFVPNVPAALRELRRVLRPGGRLFASVPGSLSPIYNRSWRRLTNPEEASNNFMVPWELETLLQQGGWTIVDGWGEYGQSLTGDGNSLESAVRNGPLKLRQAAATTWGFVAE